MTRTRSEHPVAMPVLAVHDELVVECDERHADAVATWVQECLQRGMHCYVSDVPIRVETTSASTWAGRAVEAAIDG